MRHRTMTGLWRAFGRALETAMAGVRNREDAEAVALCAREAEHAVERLLCAVARVTK